MRKTFFFRFTFLFSLRLTARCKVKVSHVYNTHFLISFWSKWGCVYSILFSHPSVDMSFRVCKIRSWVTGLSQLFLLFRSTSYRKHYYHCMYMYMHAFSAPSDIFPFSLVLLCFRVENERETKRFLTLRSAWPWRQGESNRKSCL